ncbi:MAG: hypothetical protein AAF250_06090 [Pseudomonadota bacterium]
MKFAPIAAALLIATGAPALADDSAGKVAASTAAFSIDMPIEQLVADERSKAVLDKHIPNIQDHPAYGQFKAMSLKELQPWSQGAITEDLLEKISTDLAAIA